MRSVSESRAGEADCGDSVKTRTRTITLMIARRSDGGQLRMSVGREKEVRPRSALLRPAARWLPRGGTSKFFPPAPSPLATSVPKKQRFIHPLLFRPPARSSPLALSLLTHFLSTTLYLLPALVVFALLRWSRVRRLGRLLRASLLSAGPSG